EERLAGCRNDPLDPVELRLPSADRVVPARRDDVDRVPPRDAVLLVFVAVVGDEPRVHLAHLGEEGAPVPLLTVGAHHLASDAQHLARLRLGDPGGVQDEAAVGGEPVRPARLARHIPVEEADVRAPRAIGHVDDGLEADLQPEGVRLADRPDDLVVGHVRSLERHLGGERRGLLGRVRDRRPRDVVLGHEPHRPRRLGRRPRATRAHPPPRHAADGRPGERRRHDATSWLPVRSTRGSANTPASTAPTPRTRKVCDSPGSSVTSPLSTLASGCTLSTSRVASRSSVSAVTVTSSEASPADAVVTVNRAAGSAEVRGSAKNHRPRTSPSRASRSSDAASATAATASGIDTVTDERGATDTGIVSAASRSPPKPRRATTS